MMLTFRSTGPGDDYNGGMIPLNMKVDSNDVVTSATFANANMFLESDYYRDRNAYLSVNGSFEWDFADSWKLNGELAFMRSTYERDVTFLKYRTPFQSDVTATYENVDGNDVPTITTNVNLNDPNIGWQTFTGQTTMQRDKRNADTKGLHLDLSKELGDWTLKTGYAYDGYHRNINVIDLTQALKDAYAAAIPESDVSQYLTPMTRSIYSNGVSGGGFNKWVIPDFNKISKAVNYDALLKGPGTTSTGGSYNGAGAATIDEKVNGTYVMAAYKGDLFSVPVKSNFGARFVSTDQSVTAPSVIGGNIVYLTTKASYKDVLPSFNFVANVTEHMNLRFALSKTMTRANPALLTSSLGLDTSGSSGNTGNPNLKPFYSNNFDIGGEYYTGKAGYVGLTIFKKDIKNFTYNKINSVPFSSLGVDYSTLTENQQQGLALNAGTTWAAALANPSLVANANINLTQPTNLTQLMKLTGEEFMWVQPLDNLLSGLGFTTNYTHFSATPAQYAIGIPDYTYNVTAYYEHGGFSAHLSYVKVSQVVTGVPLQANNIILNAINAARHQIDLSASYKFKAYGLDQSITLDATNLDDQGFKSYDTYTNMTTGFQSPGQTIILGWRAQY